MSKCALVRDRARWQNSPGRRGNEVARCRGESRPMEAPTLGGDYSGRAGAGRWLANWNG